MNDNQKLNLIYTLRTQLVDERKVISDLKRKLEDSDFLLKRSKVEHYNLKNEFTQLELSNEKLHIAIATKLSHNITSTLWYEMFGFLSRPSKFTIYQEPESATTTICLHYGALISHHGKLGNLKKHAKKAWPNSTKCTFIYTL